ncbi:MAG: hypothetical protein LBQ60_20990 [Bacteroidales bacterium]|jgi:hypothetical protein|nr:hypothetical protein [Bacteroidales bacterium]
MTKNEIKYVVILVLIFAAAVLFEVYRPKPINWSRTLSNNDKIPFGTHVLYNLMGEVFPGQEIIEARVPAYNFLEKDSTLEAHYIFICNNLSLDELDTKSLLNFISKGNSVFIATQYMHSGSMLSDSLHFLINDTLAQALRDTSVTFTHPELNTRPYSFQKTSNILFFEPDSLSKYTILGKNTIAKPNFIRIDHGKGNIYLHLLPLAFSNYYVLNDTTSDYAFKALSYLPPGKTVIWDEYLKQGRAGATSLLHVVMQRPQMRWAYYTSIFGILFFILIEGKRRQRIIPVVRPLRNTTLDFLNVVSRLYYQKQDHQSIARKKITFFLEQVRNLYHLPTHTLDEEFTHMLSLKSGYPQDKTQYLVWKIEQVGKQNSLTADELEKLNKTLEDFHESTLHH